jgi:hypothetical protein
MTNSIKQSGGGLALQVTKSGRYAGLVEEDADGDPTRRAGVYVYGFDGLVVVVDAERVADADRAELVVAAASETRTIHRGAAANVGIEGNGYRVQLPGCEAAGLTEGDDAPVLSSPGILVIHDGTQARLANDLTTIRSEQVST